MVREIRTNPNAFQKFVHRFLMLRSVSAILARILHHADTFMLRLTEGRHTFAELVGLPIVQLTTVGARSGTTHTTPLVGLVDQDGIALIASNFGQKRNPGWYYNLMAHPECTVQFNGKSGTYIAREARHDDEREHYWKIALSYYAGYEKYKERASPRSIPVIVLEPKK